MNDTVFTPNDEQRGRLATGYDFDASALEPVPTGDVVVGSGGLYSTANDMLKWLDWHLDRFSERGAARGQAPERRLDQALGAGVERRGRFVEDQDGRVLQHHARDRDPLLLAARDLQPALADQRVVAVRQKADEVVDLSGLRGGLDLRLRGAGSAVGDVRADRVVEQHSVLGHEADRRAKLPRNRPTRRPVSGASCTGCTHPIRRRFRAGGIGALVINRASAPSTLCRTVVQNAISPDAPQAEQSVPQHLSQPQALWLPAVRGSPQRYPARDR